MEREAATDTGGQTPEDCAPPVRGDTAFPDEQRLTKHTAPHGLLHMDVYFNKNNSVNIQQNVNFFTIFPVYFHRLFLS